MPCDMMRDYQPPSGMTGSEREEYGKLMRRVAELEQALCGLCKMMDRPDWDRLGPMNPDLAAWWAKHKEQPGCVEFEQYKVK